MHINEVDPAILEKVSRQFAKLMERAKATDFPEEAENCVALAQKLLWQSNLEEAQLLSLKELDKRSKRQYIKDGVEVGPNRYAFNYQFNSRDWKSELLEVLAKNFFCRLNDGYANVVTIVGEPKNVQMVKDLYNYLEKQIRASRRVAFNLEKEKLPSANSRYYSSERKLSQFHIHAFKNSFAKGAVASIARRLEMQQKENVEEANQAHNPNNEQLAIGYGAALVVQILTELDEAYYEFFPEQHPEAIKLRQYKAHIEYQERMKQLEKERQEREERIAAGLELPPKPAKVYKKRGRKPIYRNTLNNSAYTQGRVAGESISINPAIGPGKAALNK